MIYWAWRMLYIWIDNMRRAKLLIPPSLAIAKAKSIASSLSISESNFKASWQWLSRFRAHYGLQKMLLHENWKGVEVNKNDLELLAALEELYGIITKYNSKKSTIWIRMACFFGCLWDTYAKWWIMTCSINKFWTLNFLPTIAYLIEMHT
jgi:hypothetical protein